MLTVVPNSTNDLLEDLHAQLTPLVRRRKIRWQLFSLTGGLLTIAAYVGLAYLAFHIADTKYAGFNCLVGPVLYLGFFWIIGIPIRFFSDELDEFQGIFDYFHERTFVHSQIELLNQRVLGAKELIRIEEVRIADEVERLLVEEEDKVLRMFAELEGDALERKLEMLEIEEAIKYKRKWRSDFDDFPTILERNQKLDSEATARFRQARNNVRRSHPDFRKWDGKYVYSGLGYINYAWLKWRLESMKGWTSPDYSSRTHESADRYEDADEVSDKKRFSEVLPIGTDANEENDESRIDDSRPLSKVNAVTPNKTIPSERPQGSLFDKFSLSERPVAEVPRQKERLPKHSIIKISDKLRQEIDAKKIQIGKLGELAVMEYERTRLRHENNTLTREINHISLTNDGAGYDIQSWDGEEEIYIEVKTTVGDFWSNLFFTQNEFKTMGELKDNYYLYRICFFDTKKGKGSLFVYEGEQKIIDSFEFEEKVYRLNQKNTLI